MSNERRAALEAAFDAAEAEEEGLEVEAPEEVPDEPEVPDTEVGDEAGGEGEQAPGSKAAKPKPAAKAKPDPQKVEQEAATRQAAKKPSAGTPAAKPGVGQEVQPEVKAPQSWTPAEREHWGKLPKEAQAAVQRRELEVQQVLSRSADSRKFQDQFVRTVQPFAHLIRAQNSHPLQAVHNLMTTAAGLTSGTQPQKAAIVAEIIANYGVDIQTLDDVLSKRPVQQNQPAPGALPAPFVEALKPIHQFMSQQEQARAQHIQQIQVQAQEAVDKLDLPFLDDLREDMADLMEMASARGRIMTAEQAHAIAASANPEIKKILDQRARAARQNDTNKIIRAKKAGSSITGAPNGSATGSAKPNSRRAALAEAWDELS
jgi:hypothetical protein